MKAIVLGCGLMGSVIARDLSGSLSVDAVSVVDMSVENLRRVDGLERVKPILGDVRDPDFITRVAKDFDIAVGALPLGIDDRPVCTLKTPTYQCERTEHHYPWTGIRSIWSLIRDACCSPENSRIR